MDGAPMPSAAQWFQDTFSGTICGRNWLEGNHPGGPFSAGSAPAVLGPDPRILDFCTGCPPDRWCTNYAHDGTLAAACHDANKNVLRLRSQMLPWNMCTNLRWLTCAARGMLPGQGGPLIQFAVAPGELDIGKLHGENTHKYVMEDVYFAEVCILNELCANGHELFSLRRGQLFRCQTDQRRFNEYARLLQTV